MPVVYRYQIYFTIPIVLVACHVTKAATAGVGSNRIFKELRHSEMDEK